MHALPRVRPLPRCHACAGDLPPWLPLTLQSMSTNPRVDFVVVGDAAAPAVVPSNVRFERIGYAAMQARLADFVRQQGGNRTAVAYPNTYKANDIKPLAAELYPELSAGHEWWAWADLDVVFGDLLKFMDLAATRPACCKVPLKPNGLPKSTRLVNVYQHKAACPCEHGEEVNVICPLYPNPWRKKAWGPFTAFRSGAVVRGVGAGSAALQATALYRHSPQWRSVIESGDYAHFDEWWGPYHYSRGWETMGDVLTRLAEYAGSVVMSKLKMAFAEAKTCRDGACMFCPCGAMRMRLEPSGRLVVNEMEVMVLHLAESKYAWLHGHASFPPWVPPTAAADAAQQLWRTCVEVTGLGKMNASCGETCTSKAPIWTEWDVPGAEEQATRLTRHRVQSKWAGHIKYATRPEDIALRVRACPADGSVVGKAQKGRRRRRVVGS